MYTYKLTEAKVKILKRKLLDPNRKTRIKMLARQFGVSEMQLHRIRTGENWGHVKID
jgi:DNA-binding Xre family transcriptional regulator